jgi:hypothetical protein
MTNRLAPEREFATVFRVMEVMALVLLLSSCASTPAPEKEGCFKQETGGNKQGHAIVATRCPAGLHGLLGPV